MEIEFKDFNDANNFLKNLLNIDVAMYFQFTEERFEKIFSFVEYLNKQKLKVINQFAQNYKEGNITLRSFKAIIAQLISNDFSDFILKLNTGAGEFNFSEQDICRVCMRAFKLYNENEFLKFVKYLYEDIFTDTHQKLIKKAYLFYKSKFLLGKVQPLNLNIFDDIIKDSQSNLKKN